MLNIHERVERQTDSVGLVSLTYTQSTVQEKKKKLNKDSAQRKKKGHHTGMWTGIKRRRGERDRTNNTEHTGC